MKFVVLSVNTARANPKSRFEDMVNSHLNDGYRFLGDPQATNYLWVAFMMKEEDDAES